MESEANIPMNSNDDNQPLSPQKTGVKTTKKNAVKPSVDLSKLLNNKRSFKAFLRSLPTKKSHDIKDKVLEAFKEMEAEDLIEKENQARKKEVIYETLSLLEDSGISKSELVEFISKKA